MSAIIPIAIGILIGMLLAWFDGLLDWFLPKRFKIGRYDYP